MPWTSKLSSIYSCYCGDYPRVICLLSWRITVDAPLPCMYCLLGLDGYVVVGKNGVEKNHCAKFLFIFDDNQGPKQFHPGCHQDPAVPDGKQS